MKKLRVKNYFSIHYSFIILMILSFFVGLFNLLLLYFIFLILHELVHALTAFKLGYNLGKIKLLATGAVLEAESDEFSFSDEIKISLSAPLFNLSLAIILLGFWWIYPESYNYTQDILVINLAIFAFNILPIFPLDGGRVLLAILSKQTNRKNAVTITKVIATLLCITVFVIFIISLFIQPNFSLGIMSVTLFIGAISEDKSAVYKKVLFLDRKKKRLEKGAIETRYLMIKTEEKSKLLKFVNARFFTIFLIVDDSFNVIKTVPENQLFN